MSAPKIDPLGLTVTDSKKYQDTIDAMLRTQTYADRMAQISHHTIGASISAQVQNIQRKVETSFNLPISAHLTMEIAHADEAGAFVGKVRASAPYPSLQSIERVIVAPDMESLIAKVIGLVVEVKL